MSLLISTVAAGSRNSVAPVVELPCTMPGTLPRCSARTISTKRPLRSVMTSSCRYFADDAARVLLERAAQLLPLLAQLVADALQLGAGLVEHLAARIDRVRAPRPLRP